VPLAELVNEALPLVTPLADSFRVKIRRTDRRRGLATAFACGRLLINLLSNAIKYNGLFGSAHGAHAHGRGSRVSSRCPTPAADSARTSALICSSPSTDSESSGKASRARHRTRDREDLGDPHGRLDRRHQPAARGLDFPGEAQRADKAVVVETAPMPVDASTIERVASASLLYIGRQPHHVMLMDELVASREGWSLVSEIKGGRRRGAGHLDETRHRSRGHALPDFDGFEVLRRLRAAPETAHIPASTVSANAMAETSPRAGRGLRGILDQAINFSAFLSRWEAEAGFTQLYAALTFGRGQSEREPVVEARSSPSGSGPATQGAVMSRANSSSSSTRGRCLSTAPRIPPADALVIATVTAFRTGGIVTTSHGRR